jgi:hypothetical protein
MVKEDLLGKVFGDLEVIAAAPSTGDGQARWRCRCDCGREVEVDARYLKCGTTKSCGCYRREAARKRASSNHHW